MIIKMIMMMMTWQTQSLHTVLACS